MRKCAKCTHLAQRSIRAMTDAQVRDRCSCDRNALDTLALTLRERGLHNAVTSATFYDFCLAFARAPRNKLLPARGKFEWRVSIAWGPNAKSRRAYRHGRKRGPGSDLRARQPMMRLRCRSRRAS
jgi:hypothetical protein